MTAIECVRDVLLFFFHQKISKKIREVSKKKDIGMAQYTFTVHCENLSPVPISLHHNHHASIDLKKSKKQGFYFLCKLQNG